MKNEYDKDRLYRKLFKLRKKRMKINKKIEKYTNILEELASRKRVGMKNEGKRNVLERK